MSVRDDDPRLHYPRSIVPNVGTEVAGDRRFPRPRLEAEFDSVMTGGNGATLFGLRRIGKSTEAAACAERLTGGKRVIVRVDAQGMVSEAELLIAVLRAIPSKHWQQNVMKLIGDDNAISSVARDAIAKFTGTGKGGDIEAYFQPIAAAVTRCIRNEEGVILFIDEFPWLCQAILAADATHGARRVNQLMASLRHWRMAGMRMMLLGSIGLIALARQYEIDLSHINDLEPLSVPPLEPDEAIALIRALAVGGEIRGWTDAHTAALLEQSAALYASMLQRAFMQLTIGKHAAALDTISELFAVKIRPNLDASFYAQFDKRRAVYAKLETPVADMIDGLLVAAMSSAVPVPIEELIAVSGPNVSDADRGEALGLLREDGFLHMRVDREGKQEWSCASDLVKGWWRVRRGGRTRSRE